MSTDTNVSDDQGREPPGLGALFINIFASPGEAFAALAARPVVLWPLLAIVVGNGLLVFLYYLEVDFVWFLETSMEAAGQEPPPELSRGMGGMGQAARLVAGTLAAIASAVFVVILMLLFGGYLSFVSMLTSDGIAFKQWLALVAWASVPTLLDVLAGVVNLMLNDFTHRLPTEISMLSIGSLLGVDPAATGFLNRFLQQASVTSFWALALMVYGYKAWTGKSAGIAFAIIAAPPLALAGIGILLAVL